MGGDMENKARVPAAATKGDICTSGHVRNGNRFSRVWSHTVVVGRG